jgi:hypothetical protein
MMYIVKSEAKGRSPKWVDTLDKAINIANEFGWSKVIQTEDGATVYVTDSAPAWRPWHILIKPTKGDGAPKKTWARTWHG